MRGRSGRRYGLCECCVWCPINVCKIRHTHTQQHTSHKQPRTLRAQQSAASLATSVSSEPPLPQQLSAIPTRPLPFLLCPFTLHTSFVSIHPCPHSSNAALCLSVPSHKQHSPLPHTPVLHALLSFFRFFSVLYRRHPLKREKRRRHHPVV